MMFVHLFLMFFSIVTLHGACGFGPSGINQWELLYQVANCVSQCSGSSGGSCSGLDSVSDVLGSKLDACCFSLSTLDRLILSDLDSVSTKTDALGSQIAQVKSVVDSISTKVDSVSKLDVINKTSIDSVGSQVAQLASASDACCISLSTLDRLILSDVDSVSTKTDALGSQIAQVKSVVDSISTKVDSVSKLDVINKTSIDSVGSQVAQLASASDACCISLSTLDRLILSDVDSVSTKTDALGSQIAQVKSVVDSISTKVDSVSKLDVINKTSIDSVGSQVAQLASASDACCISLSTLDRLILSDVDSVSSKVDGANSVLAHLDTCILGTVITQAGIPLTISTSGTYTLCGDISYSGAGQAINITADDVVLDLNGYVISYSGNDYGIQVSGAESVQIKNGFMNAPGVNAGCVHILNSSQVKLSGIDVATTSYEVAWVDTSTQVEVSNVNVAFGANDVFFVSNSTGVLLQDIAVQIVTDAANNNGVFFFAGANDAIKVCSCTIAQAEEAGFKVANTSTGTLGYTFEDCHVARGSNATTGYGFWVTSGFGTPMIFKNCTAATVTNGFILFNTNNLFMDSCSAYQIGSSGSGFFLSTCDNVTCVNCDVSDTPYRGYFIGSCTDTTLSQCRAKGNSATYYGFEINDCQNVCVEGSISQSFLNGFELTTSSNITLSGCEAQNNTIGFDIQSANNVCIASVAQNNTTGFNVASTGIVLESCSASHNTTGITITGAANNTQLLNTCPVNNTTDLSDSGTNTTNISNCSISTIVTEIDNCLVGTAITQADIPLTITTSGKYIVCEDISAASDLIDIQASNVVLDLNGHTLESTTGICVIVNNVSHVVVTNGFCTSALQTISVVTGSQDVTIRDIQIYNSTEPSIHAIGTHDLTISHCGINGRNGTAVIFLGGMIRVDTCSAIVIEDTTIFGGNDFNSTPGAACVVTNTQTAEGGATIRRCTAEVLNEVGFSIATNLNDCVIEDCVVAEFIGTVKEAYKISGSGSCQLIRCSAENAGIGFSMVSYTNVVLQDCIASACSTRGFRFQSSNGVADGCIANGNVTGFNITGSNTLLSSCKSAANTTGFLITGSNTVLQQCVASGNSGSGIDNTAGTATFLIDTRSSSVAAPAYQLNGAADAFGTATIVTF